jgi:hypothetical protein
MRAYSIPDIFRSSLARPNLWFAAKVGVFAKSGPLANPQIQAANSRLPGVRIECGYRLKGWMKLGGLAHASILMYLVNQVREMNFWEAVASVGMRARCGSRGDFGFQIFDLGGPSSVWGFEERDQKGGN